MWPAFDASRWSLSSDQELVEAMAASSASFLEQAAAIKANLDLLDARLGRTKEALEEQTRRVVDVAQTQFIENRIAEVKEKAVAPSNGKAKARQAVAADQHAEDEMGEKTLIEQLEANLGDLDPLNERPLPHIIGSEAFFNDPFVGLRPSLDEGDVAGTPNRSVLPSSRLPDADEERLPPPAYDLFADPALFQSALFPGSASLLSGAPLVESPILPAAPPSSSPRPISSLLAPVQTLPQQRPPPPIPPRGEIAQNQSSLAANAGDESQDHTDIFGDDVVPFAATSKPRRGLFEDKDDDDNEEEDTGLVY